MLFRSIHADSEDDGPLPEDATVRSRWTSGGAGRADIQLANGDFGATVATAAQCWNTNFRTVYSEYSFDTTLTEGDSGDCAFTSASLPQ